MHLAQLEGLEDQHVEGTVEQLAAIRSTGQTRWAGCYLSGVHDYRALIERGVLLREVLAIPAYKTDQRRILHRGREYHFVSYDGSVANPRLGQAATEPAWYLMCAGKRWRVMAQVANQPDLVLDAALHVWLDANVPARSFEKAPALPLRRSS